MDDLAYNLILQREPPDIKTGEILRGYPWEIAIVSSGCIVGVPSDPNITITAGDVIISEGHSFDAWTGATGLNVFRIRFNFHDFTVEKWEMSKLDVFDKIFPALSKSNQKARRPGVRLHLDRISLGNAVSLFEEMEKCTREKLPCWKTLVDGHFKHFIINLLHSSSGCLRAHDESIKRIAPLVNYIDVNFRESIDFEKLALKNGMSRRTFFRYFKKATGLSPLQYLIGKRITHAGALLRGTEKQITEIAFECGFSDSNFFAREFRSFFNESASSYRKRWAN